VPNDRQEQCGSNSLVLRRIHEPWPITRGCGDPVNVDNARNKQWLLKKIIWRLQSMAEGDLSERAQARAMEIASDADIRRRPPKAPAPKPDGLQSPPIPVPGSFSNRVPIPGSTITREYKGRLLEVLVLDEGFEYAGENFKSLSGVAKRITGSHCNGYLFFNLKRGGDQ
jgi:Protein of unknown function (DUF2924)